MKALLLAAGSGIQLAPMTVSKALLPIGSQTLLERLLKQLFQMDMEQVVIVVGYQAEQLIDHVHSLQDIPPVAFVRNYRYEQTGTAESALLAAQHLKGHPFLLIDGDTVLSEQAVDRIQGSAVPALFYVAKGIFSPEEIKLALQNDRLTLRKEVDSELAKGEFIGVASFDAPSSDAFFASLELAREARPAVYYETAIERVSSIYPLSLVEIDSRDWIEIDFITDYLEAVRRFASSSQLPRIPEQVLLCPGPVMVSPRVKQALLHSDIGHRESEFIETLTRVRQKLNLVFGVSTADYTNVILTGSGTAANESLLSSYGPGKTIVILTNGEFGNRLIDLAKCHDIDVIPVDFGWGNAIDIGHVRRVIGARKVDALMMVHHETSTGMLNPIEPIGALLADLGVDFLVDAVSSLGAEPLSVENAKITFCTSSANKAIASLPGLSFVCGKKEAFMALKNNRARTRYLDLYRSYEFEELNHQTPNTPAVSLFFALEAALDELLNDTLHERMKLYGLFARLVRTRLKEMGLSFAISEEQMSRVLTTVYYPPGTDVEAFHSWVKEQNYVIYRGKGPLLGKAFQIATIGHVTEKQIETFLSLLEAAFLQNVVREDRKRVTIYEICSFGCRCGVQTSTAYE